MCSNRSVLWSSAASFLIVHSVLVSIVASSTIIIGYSQWSDLVLIKHENEWNFVNASVIPYETSLGSNCSEYSMAMEKCPTHLTITTRQLGEFPDDLFANAFRRLEFLNVSHCGITALTRKNFANADHLIELILSGNQIHALPSLLFKFAPKLESIDLSYNLIDAENIDPIAFARCPSIKKLDLSINPFGPELSKPGAYNWLLELPNLGVLNITCAFGFATLSPITNFDQNTKLIALYARNVFIIDDGNELVNRLPKLKHLISSRTYIIADYSINDNQTILDISGSFMEELFITNRFEILIANGNGINSVKFTNIVDNPVTELHLRTNRLSSIDFVEYLPNLRIADFSWNNLRTIDERKFLLLKHLIKLNLANNQLIRIDLNVLQQTPSLKVLDISHNNVHGKFKLNGNSTLDIVKSIGNQFSSVGFERKFVILNAESNDDEF